jgi:VTC domain
MTSAPRFECKYCVPASEADGVLRVARVFLDIDRAAWPDAADDGPLPVQQITSLYLDSPARTFLAWHLARRPTRFKLRLRRYSVGERGIAWAEVKHKVNGRVLKTRSPLPLGDLPSVESGRWQPSAGPAGSEPTLSDFLSRQRAFDACAQVLLRGDRRGVRGAGSERALGVTVDTDLCYQRGPAPSLLAAAAGDWRSLDVPGDGLEPSAIVELKHGGHPPVWMRRLMTRLEPRRCSYSKYVAAMRAAAIQEGGR